MAESDSPARGLSIAASRAITEALGWHPKQRRRTFWEHRVFFVPGRVLLGKQSKKMSLLVSAESVLGWLGPRWWPPKRLWTVALPELLYPPYFLYFSKSTRLFCFEIPLTKAEPANNGLRFAIYKSRNCDLYIAHLWFIIRTLAIYKSHICYLQSKLLRFISRTFAQKM